MAINKDAVFYVCSLVEFTARKTKNHRSAIVQAMQEKGIEHYLEYADVNHCLPFEQVSDEMIARYNIPIGTFDTVSECKYEVPTATAIGKVYQELALEESKKMSVAKAILHVFSSFLSDAISNFNSDVYYQNSSYLQACYDSGALLD